MPKLKTKSAVKKRFGMTGKKKVTLKPRGMRHGMSSRPQDMKRKARKVRVMHASDQGRIRQWAPYGL